MAIRSGQLNAKPTRYHARQVSYIRHLPKHAVYILIRAQNLHHHVHDRDHHTHVLRPHLAIQAAIRTPVLSRALAQTAASARTD